MHAQRKRICGKVTEQNLNWGLQNWLSTLQRSPFFRHHFSKSTLNSALFPQLLCVGRMRVDMTMYGEGQAVRVATPSRSSTTSSSSWASSSEKHAVLKLLVNTNATTASSDSVRTFRLLRARASLNLFFKFFRFRHVLHVIVKPLVGATDSDDDDDDEWLELFHTEGYWSEAEQIKKKKKTCPTLEDRVETSNLQIHSFLRRCRVALMHVVIVTSCELARESLMGVRPCQVKVQSACWHFCCQVCPFSVISKMPHLLRFSLQFDSTNTTKLQDLDV